MEVDLVTAYHTLIGTTAARYQLDPALLEAQVIVESSGDPNAFRWEPGYFTRYLKGNPRAVGFAYGPLAACSYGLLQIMLETALEVGFTGRPEALFDPATGLEWGARYLRILLDWAGGDIERALCAYNGGKGAAMSKPYATHPYADTVFKVRDSL